MADFFNGIMALINLVSILLLSGVACKVFSNYVSLHASGQDNPAIDPKFLDSFRKK
jgi:Na+/alanine symporter